MNFKDEASLSKLGFTLVELLIVMAVMGILSMTGIASFLDYNRGQTVSQAANDFVSTLSLARLSAQSQVTEFNNKGTTVLCPASNSLDGYVVSVDLTTSSYKFSISCIGLTEPKLINTVILSTPVKILSSQIENIKYNLLYGGTLVEPSGAVPPYSIVFDNNGKQKTVEIDATGKVTVE